MATDRSVFLNCPVYLLFQQHSFIVSTMPDSELDASGAEVWSFLKELTWIKEVSDHRNSRVLTRAREHIEGCMISAKRWECGAARQKRLEEVSLR